MQRISKLLPDSLQKLGIKKQVDATCIMRDFEQCCLSHIGDHIKDKFQPMYVRNGKIHVAFLSSSIANEVLFKKKKIMIELQRKYGKDRVKDLRIVL